MSKLVEASNKVVSTINELSFELESEAKGNKAAGKRARVLTNRLTKEMKEYRKESVANGKS